MNDMVLFICSFLSSFHPFILPVPAVFLSHVLFASETSRHEPARGQRKGRVTGRWVGSLHVPGLPSRGAFRLFVCLFVCLFFLVWIQGVGMGWRTAGDVRSKKEKDEIMVSEN
jgi:hypothetical protein